MSHFVDLSDYEYDQQTSIVKRPKNVGWLGANVRFETAEPDAEFLELLWQHCSVSVLQTRGLHECELCATHSSNVAERNGQRLLLGSAEIRVFARTGEVYAAPNLIWHYVVEHRYSPPCEFIEAITTGLRPSSKEYFDRLAELNLVATPTLVPGDRTTKIRFIKTQTGIERIEE